ncbi:MAG: transcriptional regulator [Deltaproteobacteria bacterium]|nr:transcriptional regulator [Deltaproteobacteria bacterium]
MRSDPTVFITEANEEPGDADVLAALAGALAPMAPPPALRARILDATRAPGRLHRFADKLAAMLDVTIDKARELLDRAADASLWERELVPGMDALWVEGGPAVAGCIRGFARLRAGVAFPDHRHLGPETTLVLEGAMLESGGATVRPGETLVMHEGSEHNYRAAPGGTDLLFFVVVGQGIAFPGGSELLHRDG